MLNKCLKLLLYQPGSRIVFIQYFSYKTLRGKTNKKVIKKVKHGDCALIYRLTLFQPPPTQLDLSKYWDRTLVSTASASYQLTSRRSTSVCCWYDRLGTSTLVEEAITDLTQIQRDMLLGTVLAIIYIQCIDYRHI